MQSIFHITGGLGKHILSSAVINSYKHRYPKKEIIVSSAYPSVFEHNPNVSESLNINKCQYFYKRYIHEKDVEIFAQEPYKQTSHILKHTHLINTWCGMIGIEYSTPPSLHLNFRELEYTNKQMSIYPKPLLIFQPFGGLGSMDHPYSWARDIHPQLAQQIINLLHEHYTIIHICNPHHPILNNCHRIDSPLSPNILFSILKYSKKRILIDSCLQHASYALNLPSLVIWNVTTPTQFGYTLHDNITSSHISKGHSESYLFDYEIGGNISECPFEKYTDMFDVEMILSNIRKYCELL